MRQVLCKAHSEVSETAYSEVDEAVLEEVARGEVSKAILGEVARGEASEATLIQIRVPIRCDPSGGNVIQSGDNFENYYGSLDF